MYLLYFILYLIASLALYGSVADPRGLKYASVGVFVLTCTTLGYLYFAGKIWTL